MAYTLSPNMNLLVPTVGSEAGPDYAFDINSSLTLIDQHDHTAGNGVPITPLAMDINADLTFGGFRALNVGGMTLSTQASYATTSNSLYVKLGSEATPLPDLFYFDGVNNIQITSGGLVNATLASIPGESYGGGTFTWRQGTGSTTPANFDIGSIVLRPNVAATTNGITLAPPSGLSTAFTMTLISALPASTKMLTIDGSGNMAAAYDVDNTTLQVSANLLGVKAGGVGTTQLANQAVTQLKIANQAVGSGQIANHAVQNISLADSSVDARVFPPLTAVASSSGNWSPPAGAGWVTIPNQSFYFTATGRPCVAKLVSDGSGNPGQIASYGVSYVRALVDGGEVARVDTPNVGSLDFYLGVLNGTHSVTIQGYSSDSSNYTEVIYMRTVIIQGA